MQWVGRRCRAASLSAGRWRSNFSLYWARLHCRLTLNPHISTINFQMGTLYYGDNLDILRRYLKDESVDLVYLDPPFNSAQN